MPQQEQINKLPLDLLIQKEVQQNLEAIGIKSISDKLYTLMSTIRTSSADLNYQRRWIWELLQNAMDTTNGERDTIVEININENNQSLAFRHNGNPFKIDNITCLVNQVSSKPRLTNLESKKRTIGKFGTGFITTHLLAEKVTLKSTVQSEKGAHKYFELILDRSGKNEDELYQGVKDATEILLKLDKLPEVIGYDFNELNTEFIYHLNENAIETAKIGIEDLQQSLPFTMAFVRSISEVRINTGTTYIYSGSKEIAPRINLHTIIISESEKKEILTIESETEDAIIALEVRVLNNEISLIEIDHSVPKLFCNYPFIGTEEFNIPVVFNSSSFSVYQERRNGIIFKDAETEEIKQNKIILTACGELLKMLLEFIATNTEYNFKKTFAVANIKMPPEYEWIGKLSRLWYQKEVVKPIQKLLLSLPIVEIYKSDKKVSILKEDGKARIWFPSATKNEVLEDIWLMASNWLPNIPREDQFKDWNKISLDGINKLTIEVMCNSIDKQSLQWLKEQLNDTHPVFKNDIEWLNKFYSIIQNESTSVVKFNTNKLAILPDQNGNFVLKAKLSLDSGDIPKELKDILFELGEDCRNDLLNTDIILQRDIAIDKEKVIRLKNIAERIRNLVIKHHNEKIKGNPLAENTKIAFHKLYSWFEKNPHRGEDFGELYANKGNILLDGDAITALREKEIKTNALLQKFHLQDIDELEALLERKIISKDKTPINPENLLISLGITSPSDLEKAKAQFGNDKDILGALNHISSGDVEKLHKVLEMIERSKRNVKTKLESTKEYDCTNWVQEGITIISGIKKNGICIKLVIRPGDSNQIILFYPEEFETLEEGKNELWYDREEDQGIYSFGRFLKKTKINKMPL